MSKFLSKFSLGQTNLPNMLWNVGVLLSVLTININRKYIQPIPWIFYLIVILSGGCYIYVYMISAYWYLLVRYPETGHFNSAIVEISLLICGVSSFFKLVYLKLNTHKMMNLVDECLSCDKFVVKETRFAKNVLQYLKIVNKRAVIVWIVMFTDGTIYNIIPLFMPGRHLSEDMYVIYGLEPMFETPNYEIASVMMATGVYFAIVSAVHITLFIIVIIGYVEAQLQSLSEELSNIWNDSEQFYNNYIIHKTHIQKDKARNMFLEIRLRDIVKFQIASINIKKYVEKEFRFIFFVDFLFMILAIVTELIGGLENTFFQMPFTLGQVVMVCLIGQRLIDASQVFESSIYSCKWENFNISNQKTVLLMLQCSQKTLTLSAGGMAFLDYPCLMFVLKCVCFFCLYNIEIYCLIYMHVCIIYMLTPILDVLKVFRKTDFVETQET